MVVVVVGRRGVVEGKRLEIYGEFCIALRWRIYLRHYLLDGCCGFSNDILLRSCRCVH